MRNVYSSTCVPKDPNNNITFTKLIEYAIDADLDLRLFTIYLPLGPTYKVTAMKDIIDATTSADSANLHVGNAGNGADGKLQVYRSITGQTLGCLNLAHFKAKSGDDFAIFDATSSHLQTEAGKPRSRVVIRHAPPRATALLPHIAATTAPRTDFEAPDETLDTATPESIRTGLAAAVSQGPSTGGSVTGTPSGGGKTGSTGTAPTSKTTPAPSQQSDVQPGQVSTIVGERSCLANPLVLKPASEVAASVDSEQGIVVHWRSILGIFQYLGSIVDQQRSVTPDQIPHNDIWSWNQPAAQATSSPASREILFDLTDDKNLARVIASYRGQTYGVPRAGYGRVQDDSLLVLSLLTRLINNTRIAGDIPTTQRLEVVP